MRHAAVAQLVDEILDQLVVDEVEEGRARLDQRHGDVERAEDRRVFDADDAGADHRQAARQLGQIDDLVAVEHVDAVERHVGGPERARADGDQDVSRPMHARSRRRSVDLDRGAGRRSAPSPRRVWTPLRAN